MSISWCELDCRALRRNIETVRGCLKHQTELMFIVKANAYGHGIEPVSQCAWDCGVRWFCVADMEEALRVRAILPSARVLVLGVAQRAEAKLAAGSGVAVAVVSAAHGRSLDAAAREAGVVLSCHPKIDTGMGRLGIPWEEAAGVIGGLARLPGLRIEGVYSHFATADEADWHFAEEQARRFRAVLDDCRTAGLDVGLRHISNSAALFRNAGWDWDGVRLGIIMYGYPPAGGPRRCTTTPILSWKSRVVQIRTVPAGFGVGYGHTHRTSAATRLATVAAGYADGYFRLTNRGFVIIRCRRWPLVGRVSMNFIVADIGPDSPVQEGDEVVLLGRQGGEAIWADEIAQWCGTIPNEILTAIRSPTR